MSNPTTIIEYSADQAAEAKSFDRQLSGRAFAILILIWLALGVLAVFAA